MEVIPWQKMYVVMLTIVYTIIIVSVMPKKLQYVIVDVMKQKKLKKLLVKLLNVDTKTNGIAAIIRSFAVFDYIQKILEASENNYTLDSDVLCAADFGAPQKRMRFVIMGIKKDIASKVTLPIGSFTGKKYRSVRDAIEDLEDVTPVYDLADDEVGMTLEEKDGLGDLAQALRNSSVLKNHIVTKTTETAMKRFRALKQGENFHALDESLKTNTYTDASRTQNTIYLRLNYDEPSGTVVNVRKSIQLSIVRSASERPLVSKLSRTVLCSAVLRTSSINR